jgi:hypothetical protein
MEIQKLCLTLEASWASDLGPARSCALSDGRACPVFSYLLLTAVEETEELNRVLEAS